MSDLADIREYVASMTDDELRQCLSRQLSTRLRAVAVAEALARHITEAVS